MIFIKLIIYFFLLFLSFTVHTMNLTHQLSRFFRKEYSLNKDNINVIIRTPLKKNIICLKPYFSILKNIHYPGLINVLLTCNNYHKYLQIELQVEGEYVTVNKKIPRGMKINESDLKTIIGRLHSLSKKKYLSKKDIINKISMRDIFPSEPITSAMLRPIWLIKKNQIVTVVINGVNFKIFSKGKSLNNAGYNENIRVKTDNGKIVYGVVNKSGEVVVYL